MFRPKPAPATDSPDSPPILNPLKTLAASWLIGRVIAALVEDGYARGYKRGLQAKPATIALAPNVEPEPCAVAQPWGWSCEIARKTYFDGGGDGIKCAGTCQLEHRRQAPQTD